MWGFSRELPLCISVIFQEEVSRPGDVSQLNPDSMFFVYDLFCFLSYCGFCLFGWFQLGVGEKERELEVR